MYIIEHSREKAKCLAFFTTSARRSYTFVLSQSEQAKVASRGRTKFASANLCVTTKKLLNHKRKYSWLKLYANIFFLSNRLFNSSDEKVDVKISLKSFAGSIFKVQPASIKSLLLVPEFANKFMFKFC